MLIVFVDRKGETSYNKPFRSISAIVAIPFQIKFSVIRIRLGFVDWQVIFRTELNYRMTPFLSDFAACFEDYSLNQKPANIMFAGF
jgi:hypothetical protein